MDRRSWPWKKKTSEKVVTAVDSTGSSLASLAGNQGNQDNAKSVNYVQISRESYAHFNELEDQVKTLNEKLSSLNEKLSLAQSEMTTKDNLVKQHTKVAEEAVSGWEKAEADALALKSQLESVTLLKLMAEDRASHLDGALKECMRQIRNVKEESEQKLHDVVFAKTKQWEKVKVELDAKIADLEQEILMSSAENAALSRSLQERSTMLMKISEEKCQADAEIEALKADIQSYEKEISSLKYELHIVSKELEIRNEEKNMSLRSAEVANKQHLEGVKKIAKLEAECQRLRGLVRKKLPGPAALAQMKLEVENLGRDYGEPKVRRSPVKVSSPHLDPVTEFSLDNIPQYHKETEFLTARLFSMEEEMKMLKEVLSTRNSELQASRNLCAKTSSKLRSLEAQMQLLNQQKQNLNLQNLQIPTEGSFTNASNPPSLTSMSEDGVDEEGSCADSCATTLISGLSCFKKEKNADKGKKADNLNPLELMEDFLEMERLAGLSADSNGAIIMPSKITCDTTENACSDVLVDVSKNMDAQRGELGLDTSANLVSSNDDASAPAFESDKNEVILTKLQSRVAFIFESQGKDTDLGKILEEMKHVLRDVQDALPQHSVNCSFDETHPAVSIQKSAPEDKEEITGSNVSTVHESKASFDSKNPLDQELSRAVSQIHDFVVSIGKEAFRCPDAHSLSEMIKTFSVSVNKVLSAEMSLVDFFLGLSRVLADASQLIVGMLRDNWRGENNNSDCIDKVTLLENSVVQPDLPKDRFSIEGNIISHSTSDPEILQGRFEANFKTSFKCSQDCEHLKVEKEKMAMNLARCTEGLEHKKFQLQETEQLVADLKSELAASQKSNSLADTQLKCMAESYKSLEMHTQELEKEMNLLRAKAETLDAELQEERRNLQEALAKCKDLEGQIQRTEKCARWSNSSSADVEVKTKQEREIAAAAEKLAECQETIFHLGRQLKTLRPSMDFIGSPNNERHRINEDFFEKASSPSHLNQPVTYSLQDSDHREMENAATIMHRIGGESPLDSFIASLSASDTEGSTIARSPIRPNHPKHRSTRSSSSTSSAPTPEKNALSFSRFFSRGRGIH